MHTFTCVWHTHTQEERRKRGRWQKNKQTKSKLFLGSHANGILNNLLSHINGGTNSICHQSMNNNVATNLMSADTPSLEYHLRETEQLLEITLLKKKLRETERAMEQIMADMATHKNSTNAGATDADRTAMTMTIQVRSYIVLLIRIYRKTFEKLTD